MKRYLKYILCLFLPLKNSIVFESNPEFSCNALPVYEELVRRKIRKKYQIYWLVEDKEKYKDEKSGNKYLNYKEKGIGKMRKMYVLATSKALIFTNRFLNKYKKNQLVINLMHGSPLKVPNSGYVEGDTCDYVITQSEIFNEKVSEILDVPLFKMVALGYPRTDILGDKIDAKEKLNIPKKTKVIVWMPTFRKNKNSGVICGDINLLGVPLLDSADKFVRINNVLKNSNIILLIKLHPAEDISQMTLNSYSDILFLSNKDLFERNVSVYGMLADSDALITDYSSVYYDYLPVNRPIGLVIDDIEEYEEKNGFAYGDYTNFVKGTYIHDLNDFEKFIINLCNGNDPDYEMRQQAIRKFCQYRDFKSTERVCDFIEEKLPAM